MARYYEETALIEFVKERTPTINGETTMECVERSIREAPTADVVPKSEVEKWFRECEELQGRMIELESEVARKIISTIKENFEIGYGGVCEFNKLLDDIEKKYTKNKGE